MDSSCTILISIILCCCVVEAKPMQKAKLLVNASNASGRKIPETFMGVFFEEINHAGAGGLWAELVSNRGFEAGGQNVPSNIYPWSIIGDEPSIYVSTDRTSCFEHNKIALRMVVLCDSSNFCPPDGVGISNPGYWGMNIEQGKKYKVVFYASSTTIISLKVSFVGSDDGVKLASEDILLAIGVNTSTTWRRVESVLEANATNQNAILQITTTNRGVIWLDQVSAMPLDTYKGHGFRKDLFDMVAELKPRFFRFPGGCFVEGQWLRNAFRWKDTIGPWEQRPGHFGDVWGYWTDDGFGYFEALQLAEDLNALPVWVFNDGISHTDEVNTSAISPFVQEALDGIEFARGTPTSTWGSVRTAMGHPEPFDLRYVAVGNEDYIQIISNCDATKKPLNHPADLYDFHHYSTANDMFHKAQEFDNASRTGPKAFVSEYAVHGKEAGTGNLLAAIAEAGFLIGLEKNSDLVKMVSYAPLFVNANDRKWNPDAIVFDSHQVYGTPSYWVLKLFRESSGATFLNSTLQTESPKLAASAISWKRSLDNKYFLRIKVVNLASKAVDLKISIEGLDPSVHLYQSTKTVLTSSNVMDENSFSQPNKVVPQQSPLENAGKKMNVTIPPYSVTLFDMLM
ncbi:Glycosyl hydrolase, all-beta [Sesbania bispinosa]|nr:Glycosyl hydrolase, all-beta [Sesbania bispinosa]